MRVLVTGHDGYIGPLLVRELLERGHEAVGLDAGYFAGCDFAGSGNPIPSVRKDVRDVEEADVAGFDAIMHLAALSNDPMGELDPELTLEINGRQSFRLAEIARRAGVGRFLLSSSCSVYGLGEGEELDEQAPMYPQSAYARSKILAEESIAQLAGDRFSPVFLRNATAFGLSPKLRFDLVVNNLVGWAVATRQIKIMSDGTPWRPLVHVRDIAAAFVAALEAPRETVHNQTFNIGAPGENYQVRDIAQIVGRAVPGCEVVFAGAGDPDSRSYRVSFGKVERQIPAFRPSWPLERGVAELAAACLERPLTLSDFESRQFTRLKQIRFLMEEGRLNAKLRLADTEPEAVA